MTTTTRIAAAVAAAALTLQLAACSSTSSSGRPVAPGTTSAAAPGPGLNERGYAEKKLGELAGFGGQSADDPAATTFVIDSITRDPDCYTGGKHDGPGHVLRLAVRVTTGTDDSAATGIGTLFTLGLMREVGADGVTRDASAVFCADPDTTLPTSLEPRQKYAGVVDVGVPQASGILLLRVPDLGGKGGWEYHY